MLKFFQINVVANSGSTGKIAEQIGLLAKMKGWDCYMAYGRWSYNSTLKLYQIGNKIDIYFGTHEQAVDYAKREIEVHIYKMKEE